MYPHIQHIPQTDSHHPTMMDVSCIVSTLLFLVSNVLHIMQRLDFKKGPHDFAKWKEFEGTYLQERWNYRVDHGGIHHTSSIINAVAWLVFTIPLLHAVWLLHNTTTRSSSRSLHLAVALLAIGGAVIELLSALLTVGSNQSLNWIAREFTLDDWGDDLLGYKVLEVVAMTVHGSLLWIDACEWLFLAIIFGFLLLSVYRSNREVFSLTWASFGMCMAVLCLIEFVADVLRFQDWRTFSNVANMVSILNRLVLFPIWLMWLGRQIITSQKNDDEGTSSFMIKSSTANDVGDDSSPVI